MIALDRRLLGWPFQIMLIIGKVFVSLEKFICALRWRGDAMDDGLQLRHWSLPEKAPHYLSLAMGEYEDEYEDKYERIKMKMVTILVTTKMTLVPPWKIDNILWWKWLLTLSQFHQCRWWWLVMCCRTSSGNDLPVFALINNLRQYGRFLRWSNDDKVSFPCKFASSTDDDWMLIHRQMSADYNFCQFSIGL